MPERPITLGTRFTMGALVLVLALAAAPPVRAVPPADRVVVIVMENESYDDVRSAPYIADLIAAGSSFADAHGVAHPSQPNYLGLWAADVMGIDDDACPPAGVPYSVDNLGHACEAAGIAWRAYSENLPAPGLPDCSFDGGLYHRRHCPWTDFDNLDHQNERPYADLAQDIADGNLPRLVFVVPNNCHNMHDCSVAVGDDWLAANVPPLLAAIGPAGLLILTWDEDYVTDNHILVVFAGDQVKTDFVSSQTIDHFSVVRTICEALGIPPMGQAVAAPAIVDVWRDPTAIDESRGVAPWLTIVGPNPCSTGTRFRLRLGDATVAVQATIYDTAGHRVADLAAGNAAGDLDLRWDGRDRAGRRVGGGVYLLRVEAGDQVAVRKLVRTR